jgi:hypothetical protein
MLPVSHRKVHSTHVRLWPLQPLLLTETNTLLYYLIMTWNSTVWSWCCSSMEAWSSMVTAPSSSTSPHAVVSQLVGLQGGNRWDRSTIDCWPIAMVQASQSTVNWTTCAWCLCKLSSCVSVWVSTWKESHNLRTLLTSALRMKTICSSEMLVYSQNATWCNNPEDHHQESYQVTISRNCPSHEICILWCNRGLHSGFSA